MSNERRKEKSEPHQNQKKKLSLSNDVQKEKISRK